MKHLSLLRHINVLPAAMLITLATATVTIAAAGEPRRIYDLESQNFIDNPDYHESAAEVRAARTNPPYHEPRRIYDLEKNQFVENPSYHDPVPTRVVINRPANYEPRRMYDAESGQYVLNPDYREATAKQVTRIAVSDRTPAQKAPKAASVMRKAEIAHHPQTIVNGHRPV